MILQHSQLEFGKENPTLQMLACQSYTFKYKLSCFFIIFILGCSIFLYYSKQTVFIFKQL